MKNICGNFHRKKTSMKKVIVLAYTYIYATCVYQHPVNLKI